MIIKQIYLQHVSLILTLTWSKQDFPFSWLLCWSCKYSLYLIPRYNGGRFSLSSKSWAGPTTVSRGGPCAVATEILVALPFTTALCNTLLYFPLLSIYIQNTILSGYIYINIYTMQLAIIKCLFNFQYTYSKFFQKFKSK